MKKPLKVVAFSNGTDFGIWDDANCGRCKKADYDGDYDDMPCRLQKRLVAASWGKRGLIGIRTAIKLGLVDKSGKRTTHLQTCTEIDLI